MEYIGKPPHVAEKVGDPLSLRVHVNDEGKIQIQIDFAEVKELERKYRRLFQAPSHPFTKNLYGFSVKEMMVSAKPDGERSGIYVDSEGICWYISPRSWSLYRIGSCESKEYRDVVLDGEVMNKGVFNEDARPYLMLFDILYWGTGKISSFLEERLSLMDNIRREIRLDTTSPIAKILRKQYYSPDEIWRVMRDRSFPKDGVIFTPKTGKPGSKSFRWKPRPSITIGLEWLKDESDFALFFSERSKRGGMRKRYYNFSRMVKVFDKRNASRLSDIASTYGVSMVEDLYTTAYKDGYMSYCWCHVTEFLAEFCYWYDPFMNKTDIDVVKIRHDKLHPENIDIVPELWALMKQPVTLDDLYRRRMSSFYKSWEPVSKRACLWSKYMKEVKAKVYARWIRQGSVLDMCAGRGTDASLYYRLSISNGLRLIHLVERDATQLHIAKTSLYTPLVYDNIADINCRLRVTQGDMNDLRLRKHLEESYDSVVCANAIQFAMDPYEDDAHGLDNIATVTKIGGHLIVIYMDGNSLQPSIEVNARLKHRDCYHSDCSNDTVEEPIVDPDLDISYYVEENRYWDEKDVPPFHTTTEQKDEKGNESIGLLYRHEPGITRVDNSYTMSSHVWVKLPSALKAVREPIVRYEDLREAMVSRGFEILCNSSLDEIHEDKSLERVAKMYRVAVFRKVQNKPYRASMLNMCDDVIEHMLNWLSVEDICILACVHRRLTDICFCFLKRDKIGWRMMNKRKKLMECDYYFSYS